LSDAFRIEPLASGHNRTPFDCGVAALDRYFREQVSQDIKRRIATCFVAVSTESNSVAGFYTLAASSVALDSLAPETAKKLPRYPVVPVALIGRLAIDGRFRSKGLGGALLADAIARVARTELGVFAVIVDAKDEAAQRFYEHHGFIVLPGQKKRLLLPLSAGVQRLAAR
jgi:ribosomal protein S18 acetylase RimI-like enzyme